MTAATRTRVTLGEQVAHSAGAGQSRCPEPVRQQVGARRRRTSRGGTGWLTAGRSRPRRRRLAVLGPGHQRARRTAVGRRIPAPVADGVGVHEVEPLVGASPANSARALGRPTVFQPMCGSDRRPGAARPRRATPPALGRPRRARRRARTGSACRRRCPAPAGRRPAAVDELGPRGPQPGHAGGEGADARAPRGRRRPSPRRSRG